LKPVEASRKKTRRATMSPSVCENIDESEAMHWRRIVAMRVSECENLPYSVTRSILKDYNVDDIGQFLKGKIAVFIPILLLTRHCDGKHSSPSNRLQHASTKHKPSKQLNMQLKKQLMRNKLPYHLLVKIVEQPKVALLIRKERYPIWRSDEHL